MDNRQPIGKHRFRYFYGLRPNSSRSQMMTGRWLDAVYRLVTPAVWVLTRVFRRECNNFAFAVLKPDLAHDLHPWLHRENGEVRLDQAWLAERYARARSGQEAGPSVEATV